ncbi:MAG: hypothetical protein M3Z02_02450 [Actinomycetota bacterium]|nr:hypothetical protein [Actinomycetota bacterium]
MTRRPAPLVIAITAAVTLGLLTGCGSGSGSGTVLQSVSRQLGDVHSAKLDLTLAAHTAGQGDARDVGFTVAGPFSLPPDGGLPTADLTYTQLRGSAAPQIVRVVSTGSAVYAGQGGKLKRLPQSQADLLKQPAATNGLGRLHVDRWVTGAKRSDGPDDGSEKTDQVTGRFDLGAFLSDLNALVGSGSDDPLGVSKLTPEQLKQLNATVTSSSATVVSGRRDHVLRSLQGRADLGKANGNVGPALAGLLPLTLSIRLKLTDVGKPVTVSAPAGS